VPLHPDRVRAIEAPNGELAFEYTPKRGPREILLSREVLRLAGFSTDMTQPLSPIALHRETVGLAVASREYLARFYANSAAPKGGLKIPGALDDEATEKLRQSWERRHRGVENAHRLAVFDANMEWVQIGISNEDAQYLELQQFAVTDIARIFRIPPHKIGDLSRSTFKNIEQQNIEFVTDTVLPWVRRWEDRLNRTLLTPEGRRTHFIGFELKGLLRGDVAARGNFYKALFGVGALSSNDIRGLEDLNAVDVGDQYYVPLNMAPADQVSDILMRLAAVGGEARIPQLMKPNGEDHDATAE
jgi:HK97 family phage portal protein